MLASSRARSREILAEGRAELRVTLHRSRCINTFDCSELNYIVLSLSYTSSSSSYELFLAKTFAL